MHWSVVSNDSRNGQIRFTRRKQESESRPHNKETEKQCSYRLPPFIYEVSHFTEVLLKKLEEEWEM